MAKVGDPGTQLGQVLLQDGFLLLQFDLASARILIFLREIVRLVSRQSLLFLFGPLLFFASCLPAQTLQFERLGAAEGLSQGMIFDLLQDHNGFLWAATKDGLNRYNGYAFQVFQNNPFDPFSISDNEINTLMEDHLGRIWVGTAGNGLSVLDPKKGRFYHLKNLSSQQINCLAQTPDGAIWVGTESGLNRVKIPEQFPPNVPDINASVQIDSFSLGTQTANLPGSFKQVVDLNATQDGKLWVSTLAQIGFYDTSTGRFQKLWDNGTLPGGELIASFFQAGPDGSMWVGQPGQLLRIRNTRVEVFRLPELSVFPLTSIVFDAQGDLYVGTRKQIFKLFSPNEAMPGTARFDLFYRFPENGVVGSTRLLADRGGLLWIGTSGYGLLKYNPGNPKFRHFLEGTSPRRIVSFGQGKTLVWQPKLGFSPMHEKKNRLGNPIWPSGQFFQMDCIEAKDGSLWVLTQENGTSHGRLVRLDAQTFNQKAIFKIPLNIGLGSRLFEDKNGTVWILGSKSVLAKFDPRTGQSIAYDFSSATGHQELAFCISANERGHFWIGTPRGLVHAVPKGEGFTFILHQNNPADPHTLNCNYILAMLDDPAQPERYCWLGTKGGGLNRIDKQTGVFDHFTTAEGLPNNVVYAVLPDEAGGLWLSTNCGLSRFDPKTGVFQNYFSVDGLQDNEFNSLSYARAADGRLFFGGVNGVTAFYPAEINPNTKLPPVFITQLKINGQAAKPGDGVLKSNIELAESITLNSEQNQLTFEFAAMDFAAPRMNQFRYRLLGAGQDWVEATTTNSATYAHLGPGTYVFEVISGGRHGIWADKPLRLKIEILPPWWRSGWAYTLYATIFAFGTWGFYRIQVNRIKFKSKLRFEQREAKRLAELDRLKTNFFSSVTHEFRTPLTLLLEPTRQLLSEAKDKAQRYRLELIENNARRLLQFVNQLLDLSKLEAGQMPLDLRPGDPAATIRAVAERFQQSAQQRSVRLELDLPTDSTQVLMDEIKWDQVVSNLLSNALKFTENGGAVSLKLIKEKSADNSKTNFWMAVGDTGGGISAKDLPHVFERFYQAEHAQGGTGIGLSLTKELVERMGGSITVESRVGVGTTFSVQTTFESNIYPQAKTLEKAMPVAQDFKPSDALPRQLASANHPLLLLIEDDNELRQFIRASLPADYRIAEAADGEQGIQMALELVPDLVLSDLVMPHKDGFEVAETLKNNATTSHIPLILLTAKSSFETKMLGLQRGADVYLTKPFRADELVAHIENLLAARIRLQSHFSKFSQDKTLAESAATAFPAQENEFLMRLIQVVEENLDNEAMDADAFARSVFISRSQLHRKISSLTGLSLTEFVRNHRLDRAREMLIQRNGSIAEIAWRTGFQNAKYFSTCFKERFGTTPSGFVSEG